MFLSNARTVPGVQWIRRDLGSGRWAERGWAWRSSWRGWGETRRPHRSEKRGEKPHHAHPPSAKTTLLLPYRYTHTHTQTHTHTHTLTRVIYFVTFQMCVCTCRCGSRQRGPVQTLWSWRQLCSSWRWLLRLVGPTQNLPQRFMGYAYLHCLSA